MNLENAVGLILAAALTVFLVIALLRPEHLGERASRASGAGSPQRGTSRGEL